MKQLIQVLYVSKLTQDSSIECINNILEKSRQNNKKNEVTGILLYRNHQFLQLLEGDELDVHYTLKKIRDDKRHQDLKILHHGPADSRLFDMWSMAFKSEYDFNPEIDYRIAQLQEKSGIRNNLELVSLLNLFYFNKVA